MTATTRGRVLVGVGAALVVGCAASGARTKAAATSAPATQGVELHVQELSFDPLLAPAHVAPALSASSATRYAIVQYMAGRGAAVLAAVLAAGGKSYGPVAHQGLLVGGLSAERLRALTDVRAVHPYHPAYKLGSELRALAATRAAAQGVAPLQLIVVPFEGGLATAQAIQGVAASMHSVTTSQGKQVFEVELMQDLLPRLAALEDVRFIEPAVTAQPLLNQAPVLINVRSNAGPPWQNRYGLDGAGQVLGVYDTGCDTGDPATLAADFTGRVTGDTANWSNTWWLDNGGAVTWADKIYDMANVSHGTMVIDAAVGNGGTSGGLLTGVAFAATAVVRPFYADSTGLTPKFLNIGRALTNAYAQGARVHNDSWGPATGTWPALKPVLNQYTAQGAAVVDDFTHTTWDMLVVIAAGNEGRQGAATIREIGCSKNSLVVGASGNGQPPSGAAVGGNYAAAAPAAQIAGFSGQGPAPGGRLKPEVVAPGAMLAMRCSQSTQATCAARSPYNAQPFFAYDAGTSFAAPLVSGTALLIRQYLTTVTGEPNPTGMLTKALLVNGAQPVAGFVPNNSQGWGRIDLEASLAGGGKVMYFDSLNEDGGSFQFVQTGQSVVFEGAIFPAATNVALTLSWYDPPSATNAGTLINDLDLTLTAAGAVYHAGVPSMANGQTVPGGPADTLNNTEKLILAAVPAACTAAPGCTITVTATTIAPAQPQPFALVVSGIASQSASASRSLHALTSLRPSAPSQEAP